MQSDDRVRRIRTKVLEERKLLSKLEHTLTNPDLKQLLRPALHALDDVEGYFLDPKVLEHPSRTSAQMARWLGAAERVLHGAMLLRQRAEKIVKKHGADAKIVGG
jgi:hypothetical protein